MQLIIAPIALHDIGPQVANLIGAGEEDKLHKFVGAVTGAERGLQSERGSQAAAATREPSGTHGMEAFLPRVTWQTRKGKVACSRSSVTALFDGKVGFPRYL